MKFDLIIKDATKEEILEFFKLAGKAGSETVINIPSNSIIKNVMPSEQYINVNSATGEAEQEETSNIDVSGQVDAEGLPWDSRIHLSNKKKSAKNVWQRRRGLQDSEYTAVKNQILGAVYAPTPAPIHTNPVVDYSAAPLVAPLPPLAPTQRNLNTLLVRIQQGFGAGRLDATYVPGLVTRLNQQFNVGCVAITDIASRPDMVEAAHSLMDQDGK